MKYQRVHDEIIQQAQIRNWTRKIAPCYVERHHIYPKCFGGNNHKDNLVFLTAKEHYIIHVLLTKIYHVGKQHGQMIEALWRFCNGNKSNKPVIRARLYEQLKIWRSKKLSEQFANRQFSKIHRQRISDSLLGKTFSEEHRHAISESLTGRKLSASHVVNRSIAQIGIKRPKSEEWCSQHSQTMKGRSSHMKGKHHSEATKLKISETKRAKRNHI